LEHDDHRWITCEDTPIYVNTQKGVNEKYKRLKHISKIPDNHVLDNKHINNRRFMRVEQYYAHLKFLDLLEMAIYDRKCIVQNSLDRYRNYMDRPYFHESKQEFGNTVCPYSCGKGLANRERYISD